MTQKNESRRYDTAWAESLIDYAQTADIGGDPLVIDLADALGHALRRIIELEDRADDLDEAWTPGGRSPAFAGPPRG